MTHYKTMTGLAKACERTITEIESLGTDNGPEYDRLAARSSNLIHQCKSLWSNPADAADFAVLANRLAGAWNRLHYPNA